MSDWWSQREGESDKMRRDLDSEYDRMDMMPRKMEKKKEEKDVKKDDQSQRSLSEAGGSI